MKCGGYAAIGHLLANKSEDKYFDIIKHFCTVIFCHLDETQVQKSKGFWLLKQFFDNVQINVESFAKFFCGILRTHDTDKLFLELEVEKMVWDLVKFDFDQFKCNKLDRGLVLFRLFCIFNRFCDSTKIPLVMNQRPLCHILKEIGISLAEVNPPQQVSIQQFFQLIQDHKNDVIVKRVKKMYDEYVRDILKEDRVRYRILEKGIVAQDRKATRTISATSQHLTIFENSDSLEQPHLVEPDGKVMLRVSLLDVETKVLKGAFFDRDKIYLQVLNKNKSNPVIEMIFDVTKNNYELYSWNQALEEGKVYAKANSNRLFKAQTRFGLNPVQSSIVSSTSEVVPERRRSAPNSPTNGSMTTMGRSFSVANLSSPVTSDLPVETLGKKKLKKLPKAFMKLRSRSSSSDSSKKSLSPTSSIGSGGAVTAKSHDSNTWLKKTESCSELTRTF